MHGAGYHKIDHETGALVCLFARVRQKSHPFQLHIASVQPPDSAPFTVKGNKTITALCCIHRGGVCGSPDMLLIADGSEVQAELEFPSTSFVCGETVTAKFTSIVTPCDLLLEVYPAWVP